MAKNNEAKIKFTAETGEFNKAIKEADGSLKELRSELKLNSTQMKGAGETAELLKDRHNLLQKELEAARSKTEALSDKVEAAKRIYGENSEEVKNLQTQLNNAKNVEEGIQNEIDQTTEKLKKQKTALQGVSEKADLVGDKLIGAGKQMSKVSAGIVGAGVASVAAFNEVDEGADNAIKATGATGEAAEQLEESYKKVAGSITGDFGDIGSALGEVNTRFGFTGSKAEDATIKFLEFSQVTGMDATTAVQKVSRYMGDAGIDASEYGTVLDNLTVAAQASGISVDTLAENLTKYGAPMRALGFETEETIAIFSSWEKAGVNTEIAFSGMKKAIGTWSKEGKDSRKEFKKTLKEIKGCPDIASATTKAIEVFGQKAGPDLADAIQNGRFEFEDMLKLIEGSDGALEGTFDETVDGGYKMELAMQNAKLALGEVGDTLSTSLAPIVESASEKLKGFADWWSKLDSGTQKTILTIAGVVAAIGPVLLIMGSVAKSISAITNAINIMKNSTIIATVATKLQTAAQWLLNTSIMGCPVMWIIAGIIALVAAFAILWKKCQGFRNFFINLWEQIKVVWDQVKPYFQAIFEGIKTYFSILKDFLVAGFKIAWEGIKLAWSVAVDYFKMIWNNIKLVFSVVKTFFVGMFKTAWEGIKAVWNAVTGYFKAIWETIKGIFSVVKSVLKGDFKGAWEGIKGIVGTWKNYFSSVWNGIKNVFSSVKSWFSSTFGAAWSAIKGIFANVAGFFSGVISKIKSTFSKATDIIAKPFKSAIDKVKGFFDNLKLKFPKIKLPHFKLTGEFSLKEKTVPKLSIEWYKDGGIFTKPTIFNTPYGMKGVGEAGAEAVLPIDRLQGYISNAIDRSMQAVNLNSLASAIEDLASRPIEMNIDSRKFAVATASSTDSVNGQRATLQSRGLILD